MDEKIRRKKDDEKKLVSEMIGLYCRKNHGRDSNKLCLRCEALKDYACTRIEKCPFTETKTFCASCKVHCYNKEMREEIRKVMRFAGPWMIIYHPVLALRHGLDSLGKRGKTR